MKCLSLWQPWATLLVAGLKRIETRAWPLSYRGPLLIHASKHWDARTDRLCRQQPFAEALKKLGVTFTGVKPRMPSLPFGAIVGKVDVAGCRPTDHVELDDDSIPWRLVGDTRLLVPPLEAAFGDFEHGRFAILCLDNVRFREPVPFKGQQGVFDVPLRFVPELAPPEVASA